MNNRKFTASPQERFQELKRGTRVDFGSCLGVLGTFLESVLSCLNGVSHCDERVDPVNSTEDKSHVYNVY